jgi:hypothetical protein
MEASEGCARVGRLLPQGLLGGLPRQSSSVKPSWRWRQSARSWLLSSVAGYGGKLDSNLKDLREPWPRDKRESGRTGKW